MTEERRKGNWFMPPEGPIEHISPYCVRQEQNLVFEYDENGAFYEPLDEEK